MGDLRGLGADTGPGAIAHFQPPWEPMPKYSAKAGRDRAGLSQAVAAT